MFEALNIFITQICEDFLKGHPPSQSSLVFVDFASAAFQSCDKLISDSNVQLCVCVCVCVQQCVVCRTVKVFACYITHPNRSQQNSL